MSRPSILITGGTGKFGRKFVEHFCRKGWSVLFTSTSRERARGLSFEMGNEVDVHGLSCDLTEPESSERLLAALRKKRLTVNHLVNNARSLAFLETDGSDLASRKNFMSEYLMDVVVPYELSIGLWRAQPKALHTITNISSQYGIVAATSALYEKGAPQSPIQYGVAKAALNHLTRELAVRLAAANVRVNAIAYGGVEGRTDENFKQRYAKLVPTGRMLTDDELAGPLDFLVSDQSSSMTGQIVQVDGGWTIW